MEPFFLLLAQQEETHRADEDGLGDDAELLGLDELIHGLRIEIGECLILRELRDDIVVVGVEPFGHLHGYDVVAVFLIAVRHGEVEVELVILQTVIACGDGTDCQGLVQYRVVIGEVVARDEVDTRLLHQRPVLLAQFFGYSLELLSGRAPSPETL